MPRAELKRLIFGPSAAMPVPFDQNLKPDLGALRALTQWYIEQGLTAGRACLKVAGGVDPYNLTDDEWAAVVGATVKAAGGRATVLCGMKPKNTRHTIEDAWRATDLGVAGVQIDLPFFNFPTQDDMRRYLSDISAAIEIGIMVKNCFWFGVPSLTAETLLRLADAEHLIAIKWDVPDRDRDYDEMRKFAHLINVIDDSGDPVRCHKNGGRGYVDSCLIVNPREALRTWELLEERRYSEAQASFDHFNQPARALAAQLSERSAGDRIIRGMMAALGRPVGPPRPPTLPVTPQEMKAIRTFLNAMQWQGAMEHG